MFLYQDFFLTHLFYIKIFKRISLEISCGVLVKAVAQAKRLASDLPGLNSLQRPSVPAKLGLRPDPLHAGIWSLSSPNCKALWDCPAAPISRDIIVSSSWPYDPPPHLTCFLNTPMGAQSRLEPANRNAGTPGNLNRAGRLHEPHRLWGDPWWTF